MANKTINLNEKMPAEEEIDNIVEVADSTNPSSPDQPLNGGSDHSPPPPAENTPTNGPEKDSVEAKSSVATATSPTGNDTVPVNDIDKKMRRAERFGVPVQLSEAEKRNSRAERFGTGSGLNKAEVVDKSEELKRKARAERFGTSTTSVGTNDEEVKKKARLARFAPVSKADPEEEDKRKARAIRFSNPPLGSISQENGKEAIAGKATEGP